jgi:hypothetical protein
MAKSFQPLPLSNWKATRDTITGYTQLARTIRRENTPQQKHFWHVSLRLSCTGLTTTPIRTANGTIYELEFDFPRHLARITTSEGKQRGIPLSGQSIRQFRNEVLTALDELNIVAHCDRDLYDDNTPGEYDRTAVTTFWQTLIEISTVLKEFRYGFLEETSPVQFWPHHFDLAMVWFSGRQVPGQDPQKPEYANEQMGFGFSTGDDETADPYFYATAYPTPEGWMDDSLPEGARWFSGNWTGALLPYQAVVDAENGRELLLDFLHAAHHAGASRMVG